MLRGIVVAYLLLFASCLPLHADSVIHLGYLTNPNDNRLVKLEYPHDESGKYGYNLSVLATGSLIAADDRGLERTIQGASSKTADRAADAFNDLGNLEYVGPALGLVYLAGGRTNHDFAWKAGIAVLKAGAVGLALKEIVGRERPNGPDGKDDEFKPGSGSDSYASFPSGHTLVAFSVATVWADEKPKERYIAYGTAGLVGLARIYTHAHWPSDVFFGALLGYAQGREAYRGDTNLLSLKF